MQRDEVQVPYFPLVGGNGCVLAVSLLRMFRESRSLEPRCVINIAVHTRTTTPRMLYPAP